MKQMPKPWPFVTLAPPRTGGLHYDHLGHCTFAVSDGSALLLIDPFFAGKFHWAGTTERHLDPPQLPLSAIGRCEAILVSHEHGDHYDAATVRALLRQTRAIVYAPHVVVADAVRRGLDRRRFREVHPLRSFPVGRMNVTPFPSAGSDGVKPVDRVGFLIEARGCRLYHQGDSHGYSPSWLNFRDRLDALIMWPHRVSEVVLAIRPATVVFHHLDRFRPGNFFCNRDGKLELDYWGHYHPRIRFVVPRRNVWQKV